MKLESITRVMVKLAFTRFFSRRNQELHRANCIMSNK